jgi:hypothetical protein
VNLFDSSLLYSLDFSQRVSSFDPAVMPERPGDGLVMRPLQIGDYYKGIYSKISCTSARELVQLVYDHCLIVSPLKATSSSWPN